MHIRVVTPVVPTGLTNADDFMNILGPEDRLDFTELDHGPISVESAFDKMLAAPDVVAKIILAEAEGIDAVVIDCMEDPGLAAARECVSIPVLGPCQTAMNLACTLGYRFSIMSVSQNMGQDFETQAKVYGAWDKYASTRSVDIPVSELKGQSDLLRKKLANAAIVAITEDRADTIIIGCTGMLGVATTLQQDLKDAGYKVPVIDPISITVKTAKLLVECGLSHSKLGYPMPKVSQIGGYNGSSLHDFAAWRRT